MFTQIRKFIRLYKTTSNNANAQKMAGYKVQVNWIGEPFMYFRIPNEFMESDLTMNSFVQKRLMDTYVIFDQLNIDSLVYPVIYIDKKNANCMIHMQFNKRTIKASLILILCKFIT